MNIAEIQKMTADMPIPEVKVRLVRTYDRKEGTTKEGKPWAVQNFEVEDDSGEIRVACWNHDYDLQQMGLDGQEIILAAHKSKQHGWTGCIAIDEVYEGQTTRKIKMTASGVIKLADGTELKAVKVATNGARMSGAGKPPGAFKFRPTVQEALEFLATAHQIVVGLEPAETDALARSAMTNTLMMAFTDGRIVPDDWGKTDSPVLTEAVQPDSNGSEKPGPTSYPSMNEKGKILKLCQEKAKFAWKQDESIVKAYVGAKFGVTPEELSDDQARELKKDFLSFPTFLAFQVAFDGLTKTS